MHAALIMDGNGRWAERRGLPRVAGHRKGAATARLIIECAPALGVETLTLYAFSQDNWSRPAPETRALMELFRRTLLVETRRSAAKGIRLTVIGRRDRLTLPLLRSIEAAERATLPSAQLHSASPHSAPLHVRLAIDYSGRHSIETGSVGPDVDLLIRTGGEQRLSDFLLWESAYAELYFEPKLWPEFTRADLARALRWFRHRNRRFGGLGQYPTVHAQGDIHHLRGDRWLR